MQVKDNVFVVTGGGSGIGRELVLQLVRQGGRVAAVDVNEQTLQETQQMAGALADRISVHVVNVSDREAVEALPEAVIAAHGAVDGLINNAGIIQPFVRLNELEYEAIERVLNVNLYGPIYMTKAFLPYLMERPEAHIVNVSSMGGFFPVPGQTLYGASKAAVKLMTEGLYAELLESNVGVTVVFPGAIATNITENSGIVMDVGGEEAGNGFTALPADEAAEMIIEAMKEEKFQVYVGQDARMMNLFYRLSPLRATQFMYNQMKGLLPENGNGAAATAESEPGLSVPQKLALAGSVLAGGLLLWRLQA